MRNGMYIGYILVSIHAPLAECDISSIGFIQSAQGFYPRTPRGVRRSC